MSGGLGGDVVMSGGLGGDVVMPGGLGGDVVMSGGDVEPLEPTKIIKQCHIYHTKHIKQSTGLDGDVWRSA